MEKKTLYRYFGNCATKEERIQVLEWTKASPENLKEFCRERNIYNAILLSTDNIQRTKYDFRRHYRAPPVTAIPCSCPTVQKYGSMQVPR